MIAAIHLKIETHVRIRAYIRNHPSIAVRQQAGEKDIAASAFGLGGVIKGHTKFEQRPEITMFYPFKIISEVFSLSTYSQAVMHAQIMLHGFCLIV